ncbi:MAG: class I SAM-dependent methyltransferase [Acidimicrobiia bacterium]
MAPVAASTITDASAGTVVDVGGGTARSRALWPHSWRYVSVDPDARVQNLAGSSGAIVRLTGDATALPVPDAVADVVLMQCVSHHLDDRTWIASLDEVERILKPDGRFIFVDGVWRERRWISRAFWRLDAGHHPRAYEELEAAIGSRFQILEIDRFNLVHHSILLTCRLRSYFEASPDGPDQADSRN